MDPISIHPMLRFIGYVFLFVIHERGISIHPMLRFIAIFAHSPLEIHRISIHPMLRFILSLYAFVSLCSSFQYIPCYGLSNRERYNRWCECSFQYIPCYGLSRTGIFPDGRRKLISIHPMLRFIANGVATAESTTYNFNTSHVTVYPDPDKIIDPDDPFQYIPCYGLSCNHQHQEIYMHIFQYIPCYGLSGCFLSNKDRLFYFNTSHVTVYR